MLKRCYFLLRWFCFALALAACGQLPMTGERPATLLPASPVGPTPAPVSTTASPTVSASATPASTIVWQTFQARLLGVRFDYPAALADAGCAPAERAPSPTDPATPLSGAPASITLGYRSFVTLLPATDLSPSEYLTQTLAAQSLTLESTTEEIIGGQVGLTVNYRFGGTQRFGTLTAVKWDEGLYVFGLTAGAFCDVPAQGVTELLAYEHMKATFQFVSAPTSLSTQPLAVPGAATR